MEDSSTTAPLRLARRLRRALNQISSYVPPPPSDDPSRTKRVLLVHAHPADDSFSHAIAEAAASGARDGGHDLRRHSLYQQDFRPALTATELSHYHDDGRGVARLAADVRAALDDLRWCDSLILVYPTWWMNMPAMLKGFFDRTLVPGEGGAWRLPPPVGAGDYGAASNGLVPQLTNVKRVAGFSTYGAPRHIALLAGDNGRNTIATAVRPLFDKECTCLWLGLYDVHGASERVRGAFLQQVRECVRDLDF